MRTSAPSTKPAVCLSSGAALTQPPSKRDPDKLTRVFQTGLSTATGQGPLLPDTVAISRWQSPTNLGSMTQSLLFR